MNKKSILSFLIIMVVALLMIDFGDGEIKYELISYEDLPEKYARDFSKMGPGGTGMFEYNGHSYAFICTNPNEKVAIEFVGDAEDGVGKEIRYIVLERSEYEKTKIIDGQYGEYALYLIRLEKVVSTPFGFNNISL